MRGRRRLPGRLAVDSCAAEFEARTPYYYLSYEDADPIEATTGRAVVVVGSGRTGSARGSSSTTAVSGRPVRCGSSGTRP